MMDFSLFPIILVVALVIFVLVIFFAGFVSASPGEIKVISGPRGQRVIQGKTGWKMPPRTWKKWVWKLLPLTFRA